MSTRPTDDIIHNILYERKIFVDSHCPLQSFCFNPWPLQKIVQEEVNQIYKF